MSMTLLSSCFYLFHPCHIRLEIGKTYPVSYRPPHPPPPLLSQQHQIEWALENRVEPFPKKELKKNSVSRSHHMIAPKGLTIFLMHSSNLKKREPMSRGARASLSPFANQIERGKTYEFKPSLGLLG